jgi:hypothetical protein
MGVNRQRSKPHTIAEQADEADRNMPGESESCVTQTSFAPGIFRRLILVVRRFDQPQAKGA